MRNWKTTGLIATAVIVVLFPIYLIKAIYFDQFGVTSIGEAEPQFVGGHTCIECHKLEYDLWLGSHHDDAMDIATPASVKGDFNNAEFEYNGRIHKFYQRDGKYFVYTDGPDGEMAEFEVKYTFGIEPLQQYLVPFEGGKYQTLALTWDTEKNEWYHMADVVYPGQDIDHTNWLHWTNQAQNWNGMCADCHSTNLKKGYDFKTGNYNTTWSEIDVNCEACHGPGSFHLDWAKLPEMARPQDNNTALIVQTSNIDNIQYVNLCARCHARRSTLKDYDFKWHDPLDHMIPALVGEPMYFADGQIKEEDYVYGSFTQSKMYMNDVRCNDCHNVHSLKLVKDGNDLCLQCHIADAYDTYDHHFHKYEGEEGDPIVIDGRITYQVGEGALCINCHMSGRYYMGVDYRRDHSFRVPRPDLSDKLSTPNACNHCHTDKSSQWAAGFLLEWYGRSIRPHYGTPIAAGHRGEPGAKDKLQSIAVDELYPVIVRATAISLLGEVYTGQCDETLITALYNPEALIRQTAIRSISLSVENIIELLAPLLNDYVKAVRMEAAIKLSFIPQEQIPSKHKKTLEAALEEYRIAMEYSADFAASRHNLGNYYSNRNNPDEALLNFKEAIAIDDEFYPAKVNMAMLYNRLGQNDNAEIILKDVVNNHPEVPDAFYSLGLLLAEQQKYEEALIYLKKASELMPYYARIHYNMGLLLNYLGRKTEAEESLLRTVEIEPDNIDFIYALADFYIKTGNLPRAKIFVGQIIEKYPNLQLGYDLLDVVNQNL